jgi:hypothetical protein
MEEARSSSQFSCLRHIGLLHIHLFSIQEVLLFVINLCYRLLTLPFGYGSYVCRDGGSGLHDASDEGRPPRSTPPLVTSDASDRRRVHSVANLAETYRRK